MGGKKPKTENTPSEFIVTPEEGIKARRKKIESKIGKEGAEEREGY